MTQPKKRSAAAAAKKVAAAGAPDAPTTAKPRKRAKKKAGVTRRTAAAPSALDTESRALTAAELAFIEATIARGEAQSAGPDGELPPGATHEIVETPSGPPTVRRKRFSAA